MYSRNILFYGFFFLLYLAEGSGKPAALASAKVGLNDGEITPLEKAFFEDLDDGILEDHDLYDAFLIASQVVKPGLFVKYRKFLEEMRGRAKREVEPHPDPYKRARALLEWCHAQYFKTYYLNSFAYNIVAHGDFNCLSSGIIYALLAKDLGLDVEGVLVTDHAFCVLKDPRGKKDIQTTVAYGFDPDTEQVKKLNAFAGYRYMPGSSYSNRREVNLLAFIGALYANRISLLESTSGTSRSDLAKYKKGYYFHRDSRFFVHNMLASFQNLTLESVRGKKFQEARGYVLEADLLMGPNNIIRNQGWKYFFGEAGQLYANRYFREAVKMCEEGLNIFPGVVELEKLREQALYDLYISALTPKLNNRDYAGALELVEAGLRELPNSHGLMEIRMQLIQ